MTLSNEPQFGFVRRFEPRATRIPITHRDDIDVEIWVGGSDTAIGDEVEVLHLDGAWVIDCAGEIPKDFRAAALAVYPRVFADLEVVPSNLERLQALSKEIAAGILGAPADAARGSTGLTTSGFQGHTTSDSAEGTTESARPEQSRRTGGGEQSRRPERVFVMCTQGFNRSALVAGMILRELGAEPEAIIEAIRQARPGALTNQTFVRLLMGEPA